MDHPLLPIHLPSRTLGRERNRGCLICLWFDLTRCLFPFFSAETSGFMLCGGHRLYALGVRLAGGNRQPDP